MGSHVGLCHSQELVRWDMLRLELPDPGFSTYTETQLNVSTGQSRDGEGRGRGLHWDLRGSLNGEEV